MKSNITMRDAFFINLYEEMDKNENIYLVRLESLLIKEP